MVFRALREVGRQVRDSLADNIQQQQQQRQYYQQQQQVFSQWNAGEPGGFQPIPSPAIHVPSPPCAWPLLIHPSQTPTPFFAALLDAIFTLSLPADTSNQLDLLTPTRLAAVYDELGYPPEENLPFLLHRQAQTQTNGTADTKPHVNEAMKLAWRIFELEFSEGLHPGLTRKGFRDMMVRDALIYPAGQAAAWNKMVGKHRGALVAMGLVLPAGGMGAEVFMPGGVGQTGDVEVQRRYKERRERWVGEYKMRLGGGEQGGQGQWMDIGMAMQMENWRHRMVMDAMTPGYRVANGYGGYDYVYTGGLNW